MTFEERIAGLLERVGLSIANEPTATRALVTALEALEGDGLDDDELIVLAQAFSQAIGRISAAEADILVHRVLRAPPERREAELDRLLRRIVPLASSCFSAFHPAAVERIARRRMAVLHGRADPDSAAVAVAFVDLCGSTRWMLRAEDEEVRRLADAVHRVGYLIAGRHDILVAKFLGDGFFLVAGDRSRLVRAAIDAVGELAAGTPLNASGGIAHGRVVRRGGDYFGPSVNLAARLAEIAVAGELLADVGALSADAPISRWTTVRPRGLRRRLRVAVLEPPDADVEPRC